MRVALGFGAAAVVVGVFAIRKRYDTHVAEAERITDSLRNRQIPQTLEEGEIVSDGLAISYQEVKNWLASPVINQIIYPPPSLLSQIPESGESGESGESEDSNDETNKTDENNGNSGESGESEDSNDETNKTDENNGN